MTKIVINCPLCKKRIMDKIGEVTGTVEIKCPHCKKIVKVRLDRADNGSIRYRLIC